MEDHHVDRWHVEAWQHVKLSHTNRSIGLIIPPKPPCSGKPQTKGENQSKEANGPKRETRAHTPKLRNNVAKHQSSKPKTQIPAQTQSGLDDLVAMARGQTPDPIPNSAVKTLSANGTASQDVGESVAARSSKPETKTLEPSKQPNTKIQNLKRGVEQPGSSSGS